MNESQRCLWNSPGYTGSVNTYIAAITNFTKRGLTGFLNFLTTMVKKGIFFPKGALKGPFW